MSFEQIKLFSSVRIAVVGDIMLDRYWHGLTSRISPEAPVPVVQVSKSEERLGGAANVALNIRDLNAGVVLYGFIGEDQAGQQIKTLLTKQDIDHSLYSLPNFTTIIKGRICSRHQQLLRIDFEDPMPIQDYILLPASLEANLTNVHAMVISDYGKGTLHEVQPYIQAASRQGLPVLVDPKGHDFKKYRGATVLTPNRQEFETVVGHCPNDQALVEKGLQLIHDCDFQALVITRSEQGMTVLQRNQPPCHLPAEVLEVYDVTGAGDTVLAVIATGLAANMPIVEACQLANLAAGKVVARLGATSVSLDELKQAIAHKYPDSHQLHTAHPSLKETLIEVEKARKRGQTIVMTNGCFDLLHPGHIQYLQQAKALGHRLLIAINDDASVSRLKGYKRPISPLAHRITLLKALHCVDWVIPFSEDTPETLIKTIQPNVLVKGGDYTVEQIAGADFVLSNGGIVEILPFLPGHSSSALIEKINHLSEEIKQPCLLSQVPQVLSVAN